MKIKNNIFYLGISGSNSFLASKMFSKNSQLVGCKTISEVFDKTVSNMGSLGIVPVENSTTGSILETFDAILKKRLIICGEIILRIHHHLLSKSNKINIKDFKRCFSHPQAFSQCQKQINLMKNVSVEFTSDTASAAKFISERGNIDDVAIANNLCARIYNLEIIKSQIEDNRENFTRFFVVGSKEIIVGNKVTFVFSVAHQPGSLVKTLIPFAKWRLNLTKIESRPIPSKPWEYLFFVDMEISTKKIFMKAIREIKSSTNFIKILGFYPKGKIYEA